MQIFQSGYAIALIIIFFCGSIFVHELGHFLAARWRGLKVLKFSIGFGPKLFSWKDKDGCEYRISLLPLGGYVALPQLADMGRIEGGEGSVSDFEKMARSLPKISYTDKMIVSVAGAFFNILFAILLAVIVWIIGLPTSASINSTLIGYVPQTVAPDGVEIENPAYAAGIRAGDEILKIDGAEVSDFSKIMELVAVGGGRDINGKPSVNIQYRRGENIVETSAQALMVKMNVQTGDEIRMLSLLPAHGLKVGKVEENFPAAKAGLLAGDEIFAVDGTPVYSIYQLASILKKGADGQAFKISARRGAQEMAFSMIPEKRVSTKPLCEITVDETRGSKLTFISAALDENDPASADVKGKIRLFEFTEDEPMFADLRRGMILTQAGGARPGTVRELNTVVNGAAGKDSTRLILGDQMKVLVLSKGASSRIIDSQTQSMIGYVAADDRVTIHPGVWTQIWGSVERTWSALSSLVSPSSDIGLRHLSGPVGIGRMMYKFSVEDFSTLLSFVVLINVNLAILNLLPIPVLDGGHMLMATIARLMRRPLPEGLVAGVQGVFMLLLLGVIMYVMYFDVMRWRGDSIESADAELSNLYYISIPKK